MVLGMRDLRMRDLRMRDLRWRFLAAGVSAKGGGRV